MRYSLDPELASLVDEALAGGKAGARTSSSQLALGHVVSLYRERRDGFRGEHLVDELRRLRPGYHARQPSVTEVTEVAFAALAALGDAPSGRAYVAGLIRRAEEPALTALLLDLLSRMWDDHPQDSEAAVLSLRWATDGDSVRSTLSLWTERDDEAGDAAREVLSELMYPARDFVSVDDVVEDVVSAVAAGATNAASIGALNHLLRAAAHNARRERADAERIRHLLRHAYGATSASLRVTPADVGAILTRIESTAPQTRRAALTLVDVVSGITLSDAVPTLINTLGRLAASARTTRDRFAALPVVRDLLDIRGRGDVESALAPWSDVVAAIARSAPDDVL